jgi:hypothetical protein
LGDGIPDVVETRLYHRFVCAIEPASFTDVISSNCKKIKCDLINNNAMQASSQQTKALYMERDVFRQLKLMIFGVYYLSHPKDLKVLCLAALNQLSDCTNHNLKSQQQIDFNDQNELLPLLEC